MRIASLFASLLLLSSATASAHEPTFNAVWVQPVAPLTLRGLIVPVGWTHGLEPGIDLMVELTPYGAPGTCSSPGCRQGLFGLIATSGVALSWTTPVGNDWEIGTFAGPKLLAALAYEPGIAGRFGGEPPFNPGTAYEVGGGLDLGLELHSRKSGLYLSLVIGWQVTALFNYAATDLGGAPPSSPLFLLGASSTGTRHNDWAMGPNLNLIRIGTTF
jgi:hypothetical protein